MAEWLKPREVAAVLRLDHKTVKNIPATDLPYWRVNERGDRRYDPDDVRAYIERRMVRV